MASKTKTSKSKTKSIIRVKVELNRAGVRQMLRSDELKQHCLEYAERIASLAGDDYAAEAHVGQNRVNASVIVTTWAGYHKSLKNNTVLTAMESVRE